jgi:hypothetical protein
MGRNARPGGQDQAPLGVTDRETATSVAVNVAGTLFGGTRANLFANGRRRD